MDKVVVDSSVVIKWFVVEPYSGEARSILDRYQATATLLDEAYRLAVIHQRTVYDAMYLALSVREQSQLVTADEKLVNALQSAFPNVISVVNWSSDSL